MGNEDEDVVDENVKRAVVGVDYVSGCGNERIEGETLKYVHWGVSLVVSEESIPSHLRDS